MNDYPDEVYTLVGLIKSKGKAGLNVDDIPSDLETARKIAEGEKLVWRKSVNNESLEEIGRDYVPDNQADAEWTPSPEHLFLMADGELALHKHLAARQAEPTKPKSL